MNLNTINIKENQLQLLEDTRLYFAHCAAGCTNLQTKEKGRGRIETREYSLVTKLNWLDQWQDWSNLKGLGAVASKVDEQGEIRTDIEEFAASVRRDRGIEKQLHWCLDVIFREDASRARLDSSLLKLNVMRKAALPLLNAADFGRIGLRKKMLRAAMFVTSLDYILSGLK